MSVSFFIFAIALLLWHSARPVHTRYTAVFEPYAYTMFLAEYLCGMPELGKLEFSWGKITAAAAAAAVQYVDSH